MAQPTSPPNAIAGNAMQRAVVAEVDARQAIAQAETAAAAAVETARGQARAMLNAVPTRIARLRQRGGHAVTRALAQIDAEADASLRALGQTAFPEPLLEPATSMLAARLTGGEPELTR